MVLNRSLPSWHPDLGFLATRTVKNKFFCLLHLLYDTIFWQTVLTETLGLYCTFHLGIHSAAVFCTFSMYLYCEECIQNTKLIGSTRRASHLVGCRWDPPIFKTVYQGSLMFRAVWKSLGSYLYIFTLCPLTYLFMRERRPCVTQKSAKVGSVMEAGRGGQWNTPLGGFHCSDNTWGNFPAQCLTRLGAMDQKIIMYSISVEVIFALWIWIMVWLHFWLFIPGDTYTIYFHFQI